MATYAFWTYVCVNYIPENHKYSFSDMLDTGVYACLDDLLVFGKEVETHLANLKAVVLKRKDAGLKAKLAKCEFLKSKICFLGRKVDGDSIHTIYDKITAIKNFPRPKFVESVSSFIGLCLYCRSFISGFAKLASPLTQPLKKKVPLHWNTSGKQFQRLKRGVYKCPCLGVPDYKLPIIMYTDASALELGAVLMQQDVRG